MALITGRIIVFEGERTGIALDRSRIEVTIGEVVASGLPSPIMPFGVLPVSIAADAGTTTTFLFDETTNSQQTNYNKLITRNIGLSRFPSCNQFSIGHCDIEEYATLRGVVSGFINTVSSMGWTISCKRDASSSDDAHIEMKIYHRNDTSGSETLLDTVETGDLTTSYVDETGTWTPSSTSPEFVSTSMFVVKLRMHNTGTPP